jgi:hypothetical protein
MKSLYPQLVGFGILTASLSSAQSLPDLDSSYLAHTTTAVECIQMRVEFFPADRTPMSTSSRLSLNFGCTTNRVVLYVSNPDKGI